MFKPSYQEQWFYFVGFYDYECLIGNPFYTDPDSDCYGCARAKTVKEINASEFNPAKLISYINVMKPVLFKVEVFHKF